MLKTALSIFLLIVSYLVLFYLVLGSVAVVLGFILGLPLGFIVLPMLPMLYSIWQIFKSEQKRNYFYLFLNNIFLLFLFLLVILFNGLAMDYLLPDSLRESYVVAIFPLTAHTILIISWLKVQARILDKGEKAKRKAKNDFEDNPT